jgi:hypothetical protein
MKKIHLFGMLTLALTVAVFMGCNNQQSSKAKDADKSAKKAADDDHDHGPGPHGGVIIEFGKWHGEFTVDHKTQEATVYILGSDAIKPVALQIDKPLLSIKKPQFQIELQPKPQDGDAAGKASRYVGKHENFGKEQDFEGTFSGVVDGKPYAGDFKEDEHKEPKGGKK